MSYRVSAVEEDADRCLYWLSVGWVIPGVPDTACPFMDMDFSVQRETSVIDAPRTKMMPSDGRNIQRSMYSGVMTGLSALSRVKRERDAAITS